MTDTAGGNIRLVIGGLSVPKALARRFEFLDRLRKSGVTNMYGAAPYVMNAFSMDRSEASQVVGAWMRTFSDAPAIERARAALESDLSAIKEAMR